MDSVIHAAQCDKIGTEKRSLLADLWRSLVFRQLSKLRAGTLTIEDHYGTMTFGKEKGISARIQINSPKAYWRILTGGSIGAADAYVAKEWESDDLVSVVRLLVQNREVLMGMHRGVAWITGLIYRASHWFNRNTVEGSKRNILAHYDLGNEFYNLFLDETMAYSSGIFTTESSTLHEASVEKFDRICRKLSLSATDHLIEIGSGWGGFAIHSASRYGCRVTTTTISDAQYEYVVKAVKRAGLTDRITVLNKDYRALEGTYDKLVSIEMIEAVGADNIPEFIEVCSRLLKPSGTMAIQAITYPDRYFSEYRRTPDFIQSHIFPGSCLVSLSHLLEAANNHTDLRMAHLEDIGLHYAKTLAEWRRVFLSRQDAVRAQGFSQEFIRLWDFYFAYCEGGFAQQFISDVQLIFTKPESGYDSIVYTNGVLQ